jgi:cell division protease FtsH
LSNTAKRITFIVFFLLIALLLYDYMGGTQNQQAINYNQFLQQLEQNNVQSIESRGRTITGTYSKPRTGDDQNTYSEFKFTLPFEPDQNFIEKVREKDVQIDAESTDDSWWTMLLVNSIPILLIVGIWLYFIYRTRQSLGGGGGIMGVGESQAELHQEETPEVTFDDVAGYSGPKNEVQQIIEFLKNPEKFDRVGGEIPKGVLMMGPPGTGKTLMARAIAGEAGVPFLSTSGSDFMEMFVGVGASRVRDTFERAKELAPAIIFIDEIDSVGRKRGSGLGGGHDEREQTLNQLLNEMDGFEPNSGIILIAATNRPDILDQALLRPGRFDRQINFDLPTIEERQAILEIHAEEKPTADDVDLEEIAQGTPGFSGADLENLLNEAALLAAENGMEIIDRDTLDEARDKVMMGLQREEMVISDDEKETMAIHESGHTLVAYLTEGADPVHKVTIIPRGRALGATQQLPIEEKKMYTQEHLMGRLAVMMGGRAAEELKNETVTNGAQDDLRRATKMARKMVLQWGMSEDLGNIAFSNGDEKTFLGEDLAGGRDYSEETAEQIDNAVRDIIDEATERAETILRANQDKLDSLVDVLMEKETLSAEEISSLVDQGKLPENGEEPESESSDDEAPTETDEQSNATQEDATASDENDESDKPVDGSGTSRNGYDEESDVDQTDGEPRSEEDNRKAEEATSTDSSPDTDQTDENPEKDQITDDSEPTDAEDNGESPKSS